MKEGKKGELDELNGNRGYWGTRDKKREGLHRRVSCLLTGFACRDWKESRTAYVLLRKSADGEGGAKLSNLDLGG